MKTRTTNILTILILIWGTTAMAAHLLDLPKLKGLALATCTAPYPKVFCAATTTDNRTYETFAADFQLQYTTKNGQTKTTQITPEIYTNLKGPYNRRNVYGAVLAYGPALPENLRTTTLKNALQSKNNILHELGIPTTATNLKIIITPKNISTNTTPFIINVSNSEPKNQ